MRDCSGEAQTQISNLQEIANRYSISTAKSNEACEAENQFIISENIRDNENLNLYLRLKTHLPKRIRHMHRELCFDCCRKRLQDSIQRLSSKRGIK